MMTLTICAIIYAVCVC